MIRRWFRCSNGHDEVLSMEPKCWCCGKRGEPASAPVLRDQVGATAIRIPACH